MSFNTPAIQFSNQYMVFLQAPDLIEITEFQLVLYKMQSYIERVWHPTSGSTAAFIEMICLTILATFLTGILFEPRQSILSFNFDIL